MKSLFDLVDKTSRASRESHKEPITVHDYEMADMVEAQLDELSGGKVGADVARLAANTLSELFKRINRGECPASPFAFSGEFSLTNPEEVMNELNEAGARIHTASSGEVHKLRLNSLASISGISRTTLSAVSAGRQHLNPDELELWRKAIVQVAMDNRLPQYSYDPAFFFESLLDSYSSLASFYPTDRLELWAVRYSGLSADEVREQIEAARPTPSDYILKMCAVWRAQFESGKMDNGAVYTTFMDVLRAYTKSRRFSRGFSHVCRAVHSGIGGYNSRVAYSTNYLTMSARYSSIGESGLTPAVIFSYCLYTGLNPLTVLFWCAESETRQAGQPQFQLKGTPEDMVRWVGAIDPAQYTGLLDLCSQLGLVSDQNKWLLGLLSADYVFDNLPSAESMLHALGSTSTSLIDLVEGYAGRFSHVSFPSMRERMPFACLNSLYPVSTLHVEKTRSGLAALFMMGRQCKDMSGKLKETVAGMTEDDLVAFANKELGMNGEPTYSCASFNVRHANMIYFGLDEYLANQTDD